MHVLSGKMDLSMYVYGFYYMDLLKFFFVFLALCQTKTN